jgi:hypothetical protein
LSFVTGVTALADFTTAGAGQFDEAKARAGTPARLAIDSISPADMVDETFSERFSKDDIFF